MDTILLHRNRRPMHIMHRIDSRPRHHMPRRHTHSNIRQRTILIMVDIQILLEVDFPTGVFFVGLIVQRIVTRVDRRAVVVNLRVLPLLDTIHPHPIHLNNHQLQVDITALTAHLLQTITARVTALHTDLPLLHGIINNSTRKCHRQPIRVLPHRMVLDQCLPMLIMGLHRRVTTLNNNNIRVTPIIPHHHRSTIQDLSIIPQLPLHHKCLPIVVHPERLHLLPCHLQTTTNTIITLLAYPPQHLVLTQ
mmetsp:Transcript_4329/g.9686  ORF Transcript_4329/g.9686 Transcript_4329/m.9686 type:complete len:249 (+) Transcript_4329:440-1186(+)